MSKSTQLSNLIKKRIVNGDYALKTLPAERQLAKDSNVSHMTARRALQHLIEEGILVRNPSGRLEINRDRTLGSHSLKFAFLLPDFETPASNPYRQALDRASEVFGKVRPVFYMHWDDPLIADALAGFDGIFLLPSSEPIPAEIMRQFARSAHPVVSISHDLTAYGIPSIYLMPPVFVQRLLDHLEAQGCRRIGCLNVQPHDDVVAQRIEQWQIWMAAHRFEAPLFDEPVEPYEDTFARAYSYITQLIASGKLDDVDALICITTPAAVGAIRAMRDAGMNPGADIAICSIVDENIAAYTVPSITTMVQTDPTPYIAKCLKWMSEGGPWTGPLLMQPTDIQLVVRESTPAR